MGWMKRTMRAAVLTVFPVVTLAATNTPDSATQRLPERPVPGVWAKATNLFEAERYEECIAFCRTNVTEETLFLVAKCYVRLGQRDNLARQLREIVALCPGPEPTNSVPRTNVVASLPAIEPELPAPEIWDRATNLFAAGKYEECIGFARKNPTVAMLFLIADCYIKMRQYENAVQQLREIEAFYPAHARRAALKVLEIYEKMGKESRWFLAATDFLRKYPDAPETKQIEREMRKNLLFRHISDDIRERPD